jgi:hypothetical protein
LSKQTIVVHWIGTWTTIKMAEDTLHQVIVRLARIMLVSLNYIGNV